MKKGNGALRFFGFNLRFLIVLILISVLSIGCGGGSDDDDSNGDPVDISGIWDCYWPDEVGTTEYFIFTQSGSSLSGYWYDDYEGPLELSGTISGSTIDVIVDYPYALTWNLQATVNESRTEFSGKVVVTGVLNGEQPIHCVWRDGEATDNDGDGPIDEPGAPTSSTGTLPDTGQTGSYTDTFGDDSDYLINPPSYTKLDAQGNDLTDSDTEWTMVRDNVTGLIWEVKTGDGNIHDSDNAYTWQDAQDVFIGELNSRQFGGFSDWRVPSVKELSSIVNSGTYCCAMNTDYFPNTNSSDDWSSSGYWSFTTNASDRDVAWLVYFDFGDVDAGSYVNYDKSNSYYVRAVRGVQSAFPVFVDNGDGTVTDTTSGLMWQQETATGRRWEEAITYCEGLSLAGHADWRLPNRNELQSILNYSYSPAIDTNAFPYTACSSYWSSTTCAGNWAYAWGVYIGGNVSSHHKRNSRHVRAVRCVQ